MKPDYQKTMYACFTGYVVQAAVNNFVPLLFVTFQKSYHIPLAQITLLITINFLIQLFVDLLSAGFIDRIGYRRSIVLAHVCAALGYPSPHQGKCFSHPQCVSFSHIFPRSPDHVLR